MKYEKSCGAIIIDNAKVLLVKHNKGHWDFPKGHMEQGETEVQTAIREVKEETNINIDIDEMKRYVVTYNPEPNVVKEVVFFIAKKIDGDILLQEAEISEAEWLEYSQALEQITFQTNKDLLKKVIKDLNIC